MGRPSKRLNGASCAAFCVFRSNDWSIPLSEIGDLEMDLD